MIFQGPWIEDQNIIASHEDPNNYVPIIAPADQKPVRVSGFQEQMQFWAKSKPDQQKAALYLRHSSPRRRWQSDTLLSSVRQARSLGSAGRPYRSPPPWLTG